MSEWLVVPLSALGGFVTGFLLQVLEYRTGWFANRFPKVSQWEKAHWLDHDSSRVAGYGIKIDTPRSGSEVGGRVEVSGSYIIRPPDGSLRLFVVSSDEKRIWPKAIVEQFDVNKHRWLAEVHLGGGSTYGAKIVVAVVGQPSRVLWDYYFEVGPKTIWRHIGAWPSDSIVCDKVGVTKVTPS